MGLMRSITVGELRQNPTHMLDEVEHGETYVITRHGREIGRIVPPTPGVQLVPAKNKGGMRLTDIEPVELKTAASVDELLEDMKGEW
jgi:prevent-host-death family protein